MSLSKEKCPINNVYAILEIISVCNFEKLSLSLRYVAHPSPASASEGHGHSWQGCRIKQQKYKTPGQISDDNKYYLECPKHCTELLMLKLFVVYLKFKPNLATPTS